MFASLYRQLGYSEQMRRCTNFSRFATPIAIAIFLSSCGGFFPSKDTIVSMSISPNGGLIKPQATQQYIATATFGDNSQGDVTSQVTWSSSQTNVATIDNSGLATGVALGTTTITATSTNNVNATASLTVSNKTITSLTISASTTIISLAQGQVAQFTANVNFSDGTNMDVTNQALWSSSVESVATISSSGQATPISVGNTSIGASYGGRTATPVNLQVTE